MTETEGHDGCHRQMSRRPKVKTEIRRERERERESVWVGWWGGVGGWGGLGGGVGVQEKGCGKCDIFWCNICMMVCLFLLLLLF